MGALLAGLASLFFSLSIILSILIYPLIPRLYDLFEKLSTFQFLSNKYIQSVWNNIYVLVGVIVLFAIAIKLISTIVNPDSLSDNKKGVRGLYFRTVIAVILIFIIPILFSYSFTLQDKLVDSNFLISRVFGYKISDKTDTGQLLAWTTFNSFCTTEKKNENFDKAEKDITQISTILSTIRWTDPTGVLNAFGADSNGIKYHAILCPIAGFVVAYELFLLCMDTLFRAAKLSFLELMLPIVLGAFVFNPEILKKWAKEFFSTYLSLFLKVLAIGFMVISFVAIKGTIKNDPFFKDWLMEGFFNVLFLIALLQLVKKIPDLINTIFGTRIKTEGGIKGRLGEMAGIGGLAQKAWTSLGVGARNLAKMGLTAPVAATAAIGNEIYKKKTGKNLTDLKGIRGLRAAGSGIGTAWKTGNWQKAFEAGNKTYTTTSASPLDLMKRSKVVDEDIDKITNGNEVVDKQDMKAKEKAMDAIDARVRKIGGKNVESKNKDYQEKVQAHRIASDMSNNYQTVLKKIRERSSELRQNGQISEAEKLRDAADSFEKDGIHAGLEGSFNGIHTMRQFINDNKDAFGTTVADSLNGKNGALTAMERQYRFLTDDGRTKNRYKLSDVDLGNLGRGAKSVAFVADKNLQRNEESSKASLDIAIKGARLTAQQEKDLESYIKKGTEISNSEGFAIGRVQDESNLSQQLPVGYNVYPQPTATPTPTHGPAPAPAQVQSTLVDANGNHLTYPSQTPTQTVVQQTVVQQTTPGSTTTVSSSAPAQNIINNNITNNNTSNNTNNTNQSQNAGQTSSNAQGTQKVEVEGMQDAMQKLSADIRNASIDSVNAQKETQRTIEQQGRNTKASIDKTNENIDKMNQKNKSDNGNE